MRVGNFFSVCTNPLEACPLDVCSRFSQLFKMASHPHQRSRQPEGEATISIRRVRTRKVRCAEIPATNLGDFSRSQPRTGERDD